MSKVIIIGGGAAGMFAAVRAAECGHKVDLYEKNEKLGKKIYITGKGRCNLTNACDMEELFESVCSNKKFLYSAFYGYSNQDVIAFFEKHGMKTKTERGNRVFPVSDHSADVIDALRRAMREQGVQVHLNTEVKSLLVEKTEPISEEKTGDEITAQKHSGKKAKKRMDPQQILGIQLTDGTRISADAVIVATGGCSYPSTGSTGDGYRFAEECGHSVTPLFPSLVPINTREAYAKQLQGLSLKNVSLSVFDGKKCLYQDFGEMMFTHFGITGPLVLTASTVVGKKLREKELQIKLDLKPALTKEQLDARLLREFEAGNKKQFKNVIGSLFPAKLTPVMIEQSGIAPEKRVNEITKEERQTLIGWIKEFPLTGTGLRDYNEAIITKGGVTVKEVDPSTMESKLVKGLYFAGEVLDLDAVTGGFNLQIAWSTGYAAGSSVK
ncbi:MAG: NAD(P)/FAD-dependent oxidoreductase [Eubacteriales bacterium]|nr:NAD(P)/FAD-dependent oxidoreductase [Eubacteriales bacterium]